MSGPGRLLVPRAACVDIHGVTIRATAALSHEVVESWGSLCELFFHIIFLVVNLFGGSSGGVVVVGLSVYFLYCFGLFLYAARHAARWAQAAQKIVIF